MSEITGKPSKRSFYNNAHKILETVSPLVFNLEKKREENTDQELTVDYLVKTGKICIISQQNICFQHIFIVGVNACSYTTLWQGN